MLIIFFLVESGSACPLTALLVKINIKIAANANHHFQGVGLSIVANNINGQGQFFQVIYV